jgi:hypothetical protein
MKFCKDCKHYRGPGVAAPAEKHLCARSQQLPDLVTGEERYVKTVCAGERLSAAAHACGTDARFFVQK